MYKHLSLVQSSFQMIYLLALYKKSIILYNSSSLANPTATSFCLTHQNLRCTIIAQVNISKTHFTHCTWNMGLFPGSKTKMNIKTFVGSWVHSCAGQHLWTTYISYRKYTWVLSNRLRNKCLFYSILKVNFFTGSLTDEIPVSFERNLYKVKLPLFI